MMRKLDRRGFAAFEFILVALPLFTLTFVIFDLGRYTITVQSLKALANAGARAVMLQCYTPNQSASSCAPSQLSTTNMQNAAPFLYFGGLTPALNIAKSGNNWVVTASQASFAMLMPIWGAALNAPSATATIPF
jgi:TadE-like protein